MRYVPYIYAIAEFIIAITIATSYSRVIVEIDSYLPGIPLITIRAIWCALFLVGAFFLLLSKNRYLYFILGTLPIGVYGVVAGMIILYYKTGYISAIYYFMAYFATLALWAYYNEDSGG